MNSTVGTNEVGEELFNQDSVLVKEIFPGKKDVDFSHNLGTLSIVKYPEPRETCIEWRQCELTVDEEDEDQEWAVVKSNKKSRVRTVSGCSFAPRPPVIQIKVKNLFSFQLSRNGKELTFFEQEGHRHSCYSFQHGSAENFVNFLRGILNTSLNKRSSRIYLVMDQPQVQCLNRSFAELDLYQESSTTAISNFVRFPYVTAMDAFSKLADAVLYKNENMDFLSRSLQEEQLPTRPAEEYEVVVPKPLLPPRTLPSPSPPLTSEVWLNFFNEDGTVTESDMVREIVFQGGVEPSIRKEVWKFLLNYYPWNLTYSEREKLRKEKTEDYFRMKLQWKSFTKDQEDRFSDLKERKNLIEKDVTRTDRTLDFYASDNNPHLNQLQDILMTYVMYNFDLGYVQGMSDLLSPLLYLLQDEVDTFWCFTSVINRMDKNFDVDQARMKEQLHQLFQLVSFAEPELASYLQRQESSNMFFCFRWLLVWFKREFNYEDIYSLWEVLWVEYLCPNYHLIVCLAILDMEKQTLMSNDYGFTEILKHINELSNKMDVQLILRKAKGIYLQLTNAASIPNSIRSILGLELLPEETVCTQTNGLSPNENECEKTGNNAYDPQSEGEFEKSITMQLM